MATHSSVLAWRISGTVEPGGLPSLGSHRVGHDWSNLSVSFYDSLPGMELCPYFFCLYFCLLYFSYLLSKTLGCFSGCLMFSAGIQKLFCGIYSAFKCSFDEFVGEKVVFPSYCSAILGPPPPIHKFSFYYGLDWRRQRYPTPVLLPGKSHGWRSLVGCRPWGR